MHVVECDPDVVLVSSLASIPKRRVMHVGGKHQVLRRLIIKDRDSIGLIDQDPLSVQPLKFLQRFREIEYSEMDKLKILHYTLRNNRLIVLCPRLEEWIIEAANRARVDLSRYNLPGNPSQLHEIVNFRLNRFKQLIETLMQRSGRVRNLQTHLTRRI